MKNGEQVAAFEDAFSQYVGAKYAIALVNGTATLHTALVALGVQPGDKVAVPPLTMAATTMAVLQAGGVPVFVDVAPETWLMRDARRESGHRRIGVSLYGLHFPGMSIMPGIELVDDAAQTLRPHSGTAFTSYSFQASKILALGEGGMLVTNDEGLAQAAREFSSLGYRMAANQPRIDPATIKSPTFERHHRMGWNYRMNDLTAMRGLLYLSEAEEWLATRREAAAMYREAHAGCPWLTPQHVPEGWTHDYWTYAVAAVDNCGLAERISVSVKWQGKEMVQTPNRLRSAAEVLADSIVRLGGERPYGAWRITYHEPAFPHLAPGGTCPVAESLQPRLLQFQTNNPRSAETNAKALKRAIAEIR